MKALRLNFTLHTSHFILSFTTVLDRFPFLVIAPITLDSADVLVLTEAALLPSQDVLVRRVDALVRRVDALVRRVDVPVLVADPTLRM